MLHLLPFCQWTSGCPEGDRTGERKGTKVAEASVEDSGFHYPQAPETGTNLYSTRNMYIFLWGKYYVDSEWL